MQQILAQLLGYAYGFWRFRWHAVIAAWVLALAGWTAVLFIPDSYEARAKVYIDSDSVLRPLLSGLAINSDLMNRVELMSTVLMSKPNLAKVARETDLYLRADTPQAQEALIESLPRRVTLKGDGNNTFTITYTDPDRNMAQRVVQTLLTTFVEDTLGIKRADTTGAQKFLEEQIREYEGRLRDAEERLAEFKKRNVGLMPGQSGDYYTRMQTLMATRDDLKARYSVAMEKRNELARQIEGEEPTFGIMGDASSPTGTGSRLDGPINEYKKRLDTLLLQFTEKHPEVIALRETVADLEKQRDTEATKLAGTRRGQVSSSGSLAMNPVYQSMKIEMSRTDVEIAELRSQLSVQERSIADLRQRVTTIPEVESELTRLNRDYEVNKTQYGALLQRLESARLGEQAEASSEDLRFRIIEPPAGSLLPVAPNRPLLMSGVLVVSLLFGAAFAMLMHLLKPVFSSRAQLQELTQLPVLTSISVFGPARTRHSWSESPLLVAGSMAGLVVFYVGVTLFVRYIRIAAIGG